MKTIKISDYFELTKPKYTYIKIIPHKSIRNYNSVNIAKAIKNSYKAINNRIHKEQKKLIIETNFKISYIIDIYSKDVSFYFLVPIFFKGIIIEKIREIWSKATIEEYEIIKEHSDDTKTYQLTYEKEDALSLNVDRKSNEPLNGIMNVMEIMKDTDRITVVYNFLPRTNFGWNKQYQDTMDKIQNHKPILKERLDKKYIAISFLTLVLSILDSSIEIINDLLGNANNKNKDIGLLEALTTALDQKYELSSSTKKKRDLGVLDGQISILSYSEDKTREENNAISVCQSYRSIDEDNKLISKKVKSKFNLTDYKFNNVEVNTFSTDECQNFIQIPARELLEQFKINYTKIEEMSIPKELQNGIKRLGTVTCKGNKQDAYIENDYNNGNLPLVCIGSQGGGKTTFICNNAKDCITNNESIVVIDFIKNCSLSEDIKSITPKDRLVEIDLSNEKDLQGFGYNEIKITKDMTTYQKCNLASKQTQQIVAFIDSISVGDPLSSKMRKYLTSASNVSFVLGYNSIKDVVNCLTNYKIRSKYISELNQELKVYLDDEIQTLQELDEWSKATNDNPSTVCGTKDSKIEYILDRISILREDFKFKYMYNKNLDGNVNLVDCMNKGKVILIKIKEDEFPSKMAKNIMTTYWISKIWLACQIRGSLTEQPLRCNVFIDEVFQAPTSLNNLEYILPQSRKFGLKFIFTSQYTNQLQKIFDTLVASGSSFMLLTGCTENDFKYFKNKLANFEYEDLRDMEQYSAMCLIKYSKGYSSFITKLPYKL